MDFTECKLYLNKFDFKRKSQLKKKRKSQPICKAYLSPLHINQTTWEYIVSSKPKFSALFKKIRIIF